MNSAPRRREEMIWLAALNLALPLLASLLSEQFTQTSTRNLMVLLAVAVIAIGNLWRMLRNRGTGFRVTYAVLIVLNITTTIILGGTGFVMVLLLAATIAYALFLT